MRYAISSPEETWVKVCYQFFRRHDMTYWYVIEREQAFTEMMEDSNGALHPSWLRQKIDDLYKSVGI